MAQVSIHLAVIWGTNVGFDCLGIMFECTESLTFLVFTKR